MLPHPGIARRRFTPQNITTRNPVSAPAIRMKSHDATTSIRAARIAKPRRTGSAQAVRKNEESRKTPVTEKQQAASGSYAEAIIEAVPPLLVLDSDLRVQTANQSFCECFKISPQEALNRRVYELGNGQWNIPALRTLLEDVLPRKSFFKDFEVTHAFEGIGTRTMFL